MPDIVYGDNHLFGINHLSLEKAEAYKKKFEDQDALRDCFKMLQTHNVSAQMISSHKTAAGVVKIALEEVPDLTIHPVIPYAHAINDDAAANGVMKTAIKLLMPSFKDIVTSTMRLLLPGMTVNVPLSSVRRFTKSQVQEFGEIPRKNRGVLFINNVFCDLLVGMGMVEWFHHFKVVCEELGYRPGVITYNPVFFVKHPMPWLTVCINHNHKGYLTNISENDLTSLYSKHNVWAMGVFGSGSYTQEDVLADLSTHKFESVVYATSKEARLASFMKQWQAFTGDSGEAGQ